jgi:hypothetical protein
MNVPNVLKLFRLVTPVTNCSNIKVISDMKSLTVGGQVTGTRLILST